MLASFMIALLTLQDFFEEKMGRLNYWKNDDFSFCKDLKSSFWWVLEKFKRKKPDAANEPECSHVC